ncbi:MAG: M50 family metallopeptidase [Clostridiales bacterium]|nr:M50 family metallopeptidase [Clostridiales bacterium]
MNVVLTVLVTVLMLGILVVIHELGHYLAARSFGVGIIEFSVGFGPAIFKRKGKYNDFSVRAFPIGGYVSMIGEEDTEVPPEHAGKPSINDKKGWQKMIIVLAGPAMNILLGILLMAAVVIGTPNIASTTVAQFTDTAVSKECGLEPGDRITAVNGRSVKVYYDLAYYLYSDGNAPVDLTVERDGETVLLKDVTFPVQEVDGIEYGRFDFYVYAKQKSFSNVCYEAFWQPVSTIKTTVLSLVDTVSGRYGLAGVSGVVGVGETMNEVISSGTSFGETLLNIGYIMVLITMSLGIFNLIPLPALDGGRFVIYLIETVIRRPLNKKAVSAAISVSMILLLLLVAVITFKDIVHLF